MQKTVGFVCLQESGRRRGLELRWLPLFLPSSPTVGARQETSRQTEDQATQEGQVYK